MTGQNMQTPPGAPSPAPGATADEPKGTPHVEPPAPEVQVPEGAKDTGRYSAYDTTLAKYVGGVHDSKAKAKKAAEDKGVAEFKIVEV